MEGVFCFGEVEINVIKTVDWIVGATKDRRSNILKMGLLGRMQMNPHLLYILSCNLNKSSKFGMPHTWETEDRNIKKTVLQIKIQVKSVKACRFVI